LELSAVITNLLCHNILYSI